MNTKKYLVIIFLLTALISSCGGTSAVKKSVAYPNAVTSEIKKSFSEAEALYLAGKFSDADPVFANFIQTQPYTELTDKARFMRGEIAYSKKDFESAITHYRSAYSNIESPNVGPRARFKEALSLHKLSRDKEVADVLTKIDRRDLTALLRLRIDSLGVIASQNAGMKPYEYAVWNLRILDDYASKPALADEAGSLPKGEWISEQSALDSVKKWVADTSVPLDSIKTLPFAEFKGKTSGGYANYKYAYEMHKVGDPQAPQLIKNYVAAYPKHEYHSQAVALTGELVESSGSGAGSAGGISVGVILPLTGKFALYGKSVLQGVECAIGVYAPCEGPTGVKLIVRDSSYGTIPQIMSELANEKVVAIIGPLLAKDAIPAATEAERLRIPLISVSQQEGVAEIGDFTFRNYVSEKAEIDTLVGYATGKMKLKKIYALYPDSKKGEEYKTLLAESLKAEGGKIVGTQKYKPNQVEFASELRNRGAAEQTVGALESGGYDAIFIPDSFKAASYILPTLSMMGIPKTTYLGISRWDDQALVDRAGEDAEGSIFVDSFFKGSSDPEVVSFISKFKGTYEVQPTLLEALGFDTMKLIARAATSEGAKSAEMMRNVIARTSDFPGVAGKFGFDDKGDTVRKLKVLMVKGGRIQEVK